MKKGIWTIFLATLLILFQLFGVTGIYSDEFGIYSVCYSIFGFYLEFITDSIVIFCILNYLVAVLGIGVLILGIRAYVKDSIALKETNSFVDSYLALKDTRTLTQCAVLVALYVVLDMLQIKLPFLEFTFAFIALAGIAYIAGPVAGFLSGGICEILGYLMAPKTGPLHLGITFTAMLTGFVMGCFLYKKEIKLWRVIVSRSIVAVFLNLGLNTYWISTLIGKAYIAMLPARALKTFAELPIDIALILLVIKLISEVNKKTNQPINKTQKSKKK